MKRVLEFIIVVIVILISLIGCKIDESSLQNVSAPKEQVVKSQIILTTSNDTKSQEASLAAESGNKINLNKLNITVPANWTKKGNEDEVFFEDENKQSVGGISVVGYYGDYGPTLPNHSELLKPSEDINTSLGKGKIFTLKRGDTAASGNNETWIETHAIIPSKEKNLAYDIWAKGTKDGVLSLLKGIY